MSFVRPEARAALWRWREVLAAGALALLALRWVFFVGGLLFWIGLVVLVLAGMLGFVGWQRGRFRSGGGGAGVVQIIEGRISYFGPFDGGLCDIADITRIESTGTHWRLFHVADTSLSIPVNAEGADALFDAFTSLPGMRPGDLARKPAPGPYADNVIWRRPQPARSRGRLH